MLVNTLAVHYYLAVPFLYVNTTQNTIERTFAHICHTHFILINFLHMHVPFVSVVGGYFKKLA